MPLSMPIYRSEHVTRWHVSSYGKGQTVSPRARYWWDNHNRQPAGLVVFQYVESGILTYIENGREQHAHPGQAVIFSYAEPTSYGLKPGPRPVYRTTFLNLAGAGLLEHFQSIRQRYGSIITPDRQTVAGIHRLIDSSNPATGLSPSQHSRYVHAFVLDLADQLEGLAHGRATPVGQAIRWILARPTEDWSLKELADRFGCSREHLIRVFSRQHGKTPGQFVAQARLQRALQLLQETDLGLKDIASQSGFRSTHTLARQVARHTGLSPERYRVTIAR